MVFITVPYTRFPLIDVVNYISLNAFVSVVYFILNLNYDFKCHKIDYCYEI